MDTALSPPETSQRFVSMTDQETIDHIIARLNERKQVWADLPVSGKIAYLEQMRSGTLQVAEQWAAAAVKAKFIPETSPLIAEEWLSGPWALLFALARYIATLKQIQRNGYPVLRPGQVRTRPDGQVVVDVFPQSLYDRLLFSGVRGEVWMQPEVTPQNLHETMAVWYRRPSPRGKTALVLAAGNIAAIAPLDVLYKLLVEGQVCVLKMNPVNDYLGPFLEEAFGNLVRDGFVQLVYGGADVGDYLCHHPGIDEIHITGSAATHDAIVFGTGEEGAKRKLGGQLQNPRRVTSELGNVSPTIVVPGPWTKADLRFQAEHIMTQKMHNGGFNCIASQVLILPQDWPHSDDLLDAIRLVAMETVPRVAYYPGADRRRKAVVAAHPEAEFLDLAEDNPSPRILVHHLPHSRINDICFRTEAFSSVLAETRLPGNGAATFLRRAVEFCNENLWGTLGANLLVHPKTIKALGELLDRAIADLRYGCVALNTWTGVGFLLTPLTWGAFPGHTPEDIQSGIGVVHNSYMFDRAQKSVVTAPFYPFPRSYLHGRFTMLPRPPWFVTHRTAADLARRLIQFEAHPNPMRLPAIFYHALRG